MSRSILATPTNLPALSVTSSGENRAERSRVTNRVRASPTTVSGTGWSSGEPEDQCALLLRLGAFNNPGYHLENPRMESNSAHTEITDNQWYGR